MTQKHDAAVLSLLFQLAEQAESQDRAREFFHAAMMLKFYKSEHEALKVLRQELEDNALLGAAEITAENFVAAVA